MHWLKAGVARLPAPVQAELRRWQLARQVAAGQFRSEEPEWDQLATLVGPGDWAIDVGANVGHYTHRLSALVGASGRVIAFEPVPGTCAMLASLVARLPHQNVTVVNAAASDATRPVSMELPQFTTGLVNYYRATVTAAPAAGLARAEALALPIDGLALSGPVRLVKIDAEGHEASVLAGMRGLLARCRPVVVMEGAGATPPELAALGYRVERLPGSPNGVWRVPPA
jgi:FkbM family methyltransferase